MGKRTTKSYKKIVSRLDLEQWRRADTIRRKYGFKSIYEMNQYLWACFLRVADPDNDTEEQPVSEEIEAMFCDLSEAEKHFEYVKPKKRLPQKQPDNTNIIQYKLWEE